MHYSCDVEIKKFQIADININESNAMQMYENLCDAIGNTPLVRVNLNPTALGKLYAKLEYLNPGGSVKDRSALFMIEEDRAHWIIKTRWHHY